MCLGEIYQLLDVTGDRAVGQRDGTQAELSLITLEDPVAPGDWVITHAGFALERLSADDAAQALALRQQPAADPSPHLEEQP